MNPGMNTLHPYPFEKLAALTSGVDLPRLSRIPLTIGEPKHQPPAHVLEALVASIEEMAKYPTIVGTAELGSKSQAGLPCGLKRALLTL